MAWTNDNPVAIGAPTKKSDYDALWDNCDMFKTQHGTDGTHGVVTATSVNACTISGGTGLWQLVPAANYTATPASTSTLTMGVDMTATIDVGDSLEYTIGGVVYRGMVTAIAANLLTIAGAPMGGDVSNLRFGGGTMRKIHIIIPRAYEDANNTALIASNLNSQLLWKLRTSYLIQYAVYSKTHDSGTHGQASVRINNTEVNTTAGGLTIAADATWYSTVVDLDTAAYDIQYGEVFEVTAVKAGNGDATYLTVEAIFLTP